ncbi:MAG: sulfotransferase family 2 domain-containing protein [Planctomycetota bacterium]
MILSHRHRFIFLKTAKTAGTSVEIALSRHTGPEDIITPISASDERLRKECGGHGPQNHLLPLRSLTARQLAGVALQFRRPGFYNHMSAAEVRQLAGEDVWGRSFRFCIERNPFDRVISLYWWCHRREPRPSISEFLRSSQLQLLTKHGIEMYTDRSGRLMVDQVLRYERLEEELEGVRLKLGLPEPLVLPRAKSGHRPDHRSWRDVFSSVDRQLLEEHFSRELRLFEYEW